MIKERSTLHKVNQETYARLFARLLDEPASTHTLAEITGLHIVTVQSLTRVLRRHKIIHIADWEPDSRDRDTTPVFALGRGKDKKRRVLSSTERAQRYRARKAVKPQPELAAFFGVGI